MRLNLDGSVIGMSIFPVSNSNESPSPNFEDARLPGILFFVCVFVASASSLPGD